MNPIAQVYNGLKEKAGYFIVVGAVTAFTSAGILSANQHFDIPFISPQKPDVVERLDEINDKLDDNVGTLTYIAQNPQILKEAKSLLEEKTNLENSPEYKQYLDTDDDDGKSDLPAYAIFAGISLYAIGSLLKRKNKGNNHQAQTVQ